MRIPLLPRAFAVAALASIALLADAAEPTRITDAQGAVEAAKRYVKGRCPLEARCTFRAEREGKQWRVWVQPAKRGSSSDAASVILFFDTGGNLIRRLEGD